MHYQIDTTEEHYMTLLSLLGTYGAVEPVVDTPNRFICTPSHDGDNMDVCKMVLSGIRAQLIVQCLIWETPLQEVR